MDAGFAGSDLLGYSAAGLVLLTFLAQSMATLRAVAIASNVMFIAYALVAWLPPVLVLHALLLPLNAWRLWQASRSQPRVHERIEPTLVLRAPSMASFRASLAPFEGSPQRADERSRR
jgi:CRP/FNR family transcriptional regulator, cyclic AMP receptor protein